MSEPHPKLIEVAKAIARGCNLDPDAISPKAAKSGHQIPEWYFFQPAARAAIQALLTPTEDMLERGGCEMPWVLTDDTTFDEQVEMAKSGYQAMLSTILEQEKGDVAPA